MTFNPKHGGWPPTIYKSSNHINGEEEEETFINGPPLFTREIILFSQKKESTSNIPTYFLIYSSMFQQIINIFP